MKKSKSIVSKISFNILFYIIVLGILSTILVYFYSSQEFVNNAKNVLIEETIEQSNRVTSRLNFASDITSTISKQNFVRDFLLGNDTLTYNQKLERLNQYSINGYYSAIYVMDKNGDTLLSTDPAFLGKNYAFRDYFTKSITGQVYYDASFGVTSGELGYYISAPIYDNSNKAIGVLVTKLKDVYLSQIIEIESGNNSNVFLTDRYGVIIYSTRKDNILSTLGEINPNFKQFLLDSKRYGNSTLEALSYSYIQNSLFGLKKTETMEFYDSKHKESEIIGYAPILNNDFFLVVETESDKVKTSSLRISLLLATMVLLCMILAVVVIYYNIRKYLSPLKDLSLVIERISKGDYKTRAMISTDDELGQIAISINQMAAFVERSNVDLTEKVKQRTKHLESLNKYMVDREIKMIDLKNKIKDLESGKGK